MYRERRPWWTWVSWYQNAVSILDCIGAKDDGVMVTDGAIRHANLSSRHIVTNNKQNIQLFYRPDTLPVAPSTVSEHSRKKYHTPRT